MTAPPEGTIGLPLKRKGKKVTWESTLPINLPIDYTSLIQRGRPLEEFVKPPSLGSYPLAGFFSGILTGGTGVAGAPEALLGAGGKVLKAIEESPRELRTRVDFPRENGEISSFIPESIQQVPVFEGKTKTEIRALARVGRQTLSALRDSSLFEDIKKWRTKWGEEVPTQLASRYSGIDIPFSWKWFLYRGPEAIGTMAAIIAPAVAGGAIGGPTAAAIVGGTIAGAMEAGLSYDDYVQKLMEKGYTANEAEEIAGLGAIGYGTAAGIVEVFPLMKIFGKAPTLRARFMRALSSALSEGSEESIQTFLDRTTQALSGIDEEALEKMTLSELLQSFTLGALPGFAFGASTPASTEAKIDAAMKRIEGLENIIYEKAIDEAQLRSEVGATKEMVREILTKPSEVKDNKELLDKLGEARRRIAAAEKKIREKERGVGTLMTKPSGAELTSKESRALRAQMEERRKEKRIEEEGLIAAEEEEAEEKKPEPVRVIRPTAPEPPAVDLDSLKPNEIVGRIVRVYRAGEPRGPLIHGGTKQAATEAATGREITSRRVTLNNPAILVDSGRSHDVRPVALAEDLVAGGNKGLDQNFPSIIKKILDDQGPEAAFRAIARALRTQGYDGVVYENVNEHKGSTSVILLGEERAPEPPGEVSKVETSKSMPEQTAALKTLESKLEEIKTGIATFYHGTTTEAAKVISKVGYLPSDFSASVKRIYQLHGIPWETRRSIPKEVREYIEGDIRFRFEADDSAQRFIAFSTRGVAERWAGKGGEINQELDLRIRQWLAAKGDGVRTADEFFEWLDSPRAREVKYRDLGEPIILSARLRLDPKQQRYLISTLEGYIQAVKSGDVTALEALQSWEETFKEIQVTPKEIIPEKLTSRQAKALLTESSVNAYPSKPWTGSGKAETEGELRAEFREALGGPKEVADQVFDWSLKEGRIRLPKKAGRPSTSVGRGNVGIGAAEAMQIQPGKAPGRRMVAKSEEEKKERVAKIDALNTVMEGMPPRQVRILQLKFGTRMTQDEIASELELPVEDVELLEQEALIALRERILESADPETAESLRENLQNRIERRGIIYVGWVDDIAKQIRASYFMAQSGVLPFLEGSQKLFQHYALRGATFIEQFGESGERLAQDLREIDFATHKAARNDIEDLKKVLKGFNREQRKLIMQFVNSRPEALERIQSMENRKLATRIMQASMETREILDRVLNAWREVGGMRKVRGKLLTPQGTGAAFPQSLSREGRRILDQFKENSDGLTPDLQRVVEHLVETGQAKTGQAALIKLANFNASRLRGTNPYLEETRLELPIEMVEWDPDAVLPGTIEGAWKFVEAVRRWGYARGRFPVVSAYLTKMTSEVRLGEEAFKVIEPFIMAEFGLPQRVPTWVTRPLMAINKWETITKLGLSPLSVLRNGLDRYSKGLAVASLTTNIQATLKYPPIINQWLKSGRRIQEEVIRAGAQWSLTHLSEGAEGAGKLTHFTMAMFKAAERGNQSYIALIKSMQVQKDLATLGRIERSGAVHNRMRSILSLGWNSRDELYRRIQSSWVTEAPLDDVLYRATSGQRLSRNDLDSIMHRAVRDLAFPVTLSTKRIWWHDSPWLRLAFKFKVWGSDQVGHIYKDVIKRARHGNIAPLIRFIGAMIFAGEIYNLLRDLLFGKEESITMSMIRRPDRRNVEDIAARCFYNFLDGGGVGIVADLTYGLTEFAVGPVGSTFENAATVGVHVANRPSIKQIRNAVTRGISQEFIASRQFDAAIQQIDRALQPGRNNIGEYVKWRERVFEWREKNGKGTEGRVDTFVTNVLRGWKDDFDVSSRTLTYDLVARQITVGDIEDAADHLAAILKGVKGKERKDLIESTMASMRARSPLGRLAEEDEISFMSELTMDQRREAKRFDALWLSRYQKAIGLAVRGTWLKTP